MYNLIATNVGSGASSGPIEITDTLPEGLTPVTPEGTDSGTDGQPASFPCAVLEQTVTCTDPNPVAPGRMVQVLIPVVVSPSAPPVVANRASVLGGGSGEARAFTETRIDTEATSFGAVSGPAGLSLAFTGSEAAPVTQGGSHPYQVTIDVGLETALAGQALVSAGHLRNLKVDLPRGMSLNPTATPQLCSEAQLQRDLCPDASAVGVGAVQLALGPPEVGTSPLYNMISPPGAVAELGMDVFGLGVFIHLLGGVDASREYRLSLSGHDLLARSLNPAIGVQIQLWGDPSDENHEGVRGKCTFFGGSCPVDAADASFLSMPGSCTRSLSMGIAVSSWEDPGRSLLFDGQPEDPLGAPVSLDGCNNLSFDPTIEARPTTNLADSPSGLNLTLHLPQDQNLGRLADANLKNATIVLPEGMAINPSFATGTGACTQTQVDLRGSEPAGCPDASTLGTVMVKTPLLDHPLPGALYLAEPFDNPFGSLLAVYLAIDDPQSGVVIKLPGKVIADPQTGQLSIGFTESPELPFEELALHLFGGPRAPLRTTANCVTSTVSATMTPWSTPEGADADPSDRFAVTAAPGGGPCAREEAIAPNAPSFTAGTIAPQAGAQTPFVFKLWREDGTQTLGGVQATLPAGLLANLAGVSRCSETQIARAHPSCPADSEVGTVDITAGAGITPLHLQGHAYLAGPYKGAPLSLLTIVPAVAGPFDLGTVAVRSALRVDPGSARVHAVSDPLPTILDGIPLDLRSIALKLDRPGFALNPTSCDPMSVSATVTSALGAATNLSAPFQLGGCRALGFDPRLSLGLKGRTSRGGHPDLRATLTVPKARQTNLARLQLGLPRSLGLDHSATGTVRKLYGHAMARTPLLGESLRGPISLRSSKQGPELVVMLRGEGIEVSSAAKLNSAGGRLRADFEAFTDAPVSKVVLQIDGGRGGLLINRANLCKKAGRAEALFTGQNGKAYEASPLLAMPCKSASPGRSQGAHR